VKKINWVELIFSSIISILVVIGLSFQLYQDLTLVIKKFYLGILVFLGSFIIIYFITKFLFKKLNNLKPKENKPSKSKILKLFNAHPFKFSLICMLLGWSIYILAFYPSLLAPDPSNQILQFFGIDNYYSHISVLLDESVIITNHHPVLHTLILGSCTKLGTLLGSVNIGLFIYTCIQTIILASTLSYTISFLKSRGINRKFLLTTLIIYTFVPVFPMYAIVPVKDVIFGCLIILYIIEIYKYIIVLEKPNILRLLLLLVLIMLFRNNGFHIIILSLPFLLIPKNNGRKRILFLVIFTLTFNYSYNNVVLPYFKITPSSPREKLSLPFQQTARLARDHPESITEKEREIIDKILIYDTLSERYDAEFADPVKNKFNKLTTDEDLKEYYKVWFNGLKKEPITYIEATLENTYGYYYPFKTDWYIYSKYKTKLKDNGFDYHFNKLSGLRKTLVNFGKIFPYIPPIGLIVNIGFSTWVIMFMISYLIKRKNYKEILIFSPSIVAFMVCIASPVNTYFRYALPNVFAMTLLIGLFISIIKKKEVKNER